MKVDTRYILLGFVGIILLVTAIAIPSLIINNQNNPYDGPAASAKLGSMLPDDITIEGSIIDSYVDVLYTMRFDNSESVTASEIN